MLSSSAEYLQALRAGKYLLFLEWPQFIGHYYATDVFKPTADDILNLLVFEWLNHGFSDTDIQHFAILYAVDSLDPNLFKDVLSCALGTLTLVISQCLVYRNNHLDTHYMSQKKLGLNEINQLMKCNEALMENETFASNIGIEQRNLSLIAKDADQQDIDNAYKTLLPILKLRYLVEDYRFALDAAKLPDDQLKSTRLSLIVSLAKYLQTQMELTAQVTKEIDPYLKAIWAQQPAPIEKAYLDALAPASFVEKILKCVTDFGLTFFSMSQPPRVAQLTDLKSESTTSIEGSAKTSTFIQ